jgi:hypothetical protein
MKRTVCFVVACVLVLSFTASAQTQNALNSGNNNDVYTVTKTATPMNSSPTMSNNPDPCTIDTVIEYTLDTPGHVRMGIYDAAGNLLVFLVDEYQEAGLHSTVWNVTNRESGTYTCALNNGNFLYTRKILVLR